MMPHNFNKLKILRMCNTLLAMNLVLFTTALIKSQLLITHAFSSFEDTSMLLLLLLLRRRLCLARIASPDAALLLLLLLLHQLASLSFLHKHSYRSLNFTIRIQQCMHERKFGVGTKEHHFQVGEVLHVRLRKSIFSSHLSQQDFHPSYSFSQVETAGSSHRK